MNSSTASDFELATLRGQVDALSLALTTIVRTLLPITTVACAAELSRAREHLRAEDADMGTDPMAIVARDELLERILESLRH